MSVFLATALLLAAGGHAAMAVQAANAWGTPSQTAPSTDEQAVVCGDRLHGGDCGVLCGITGVVTASAGAITLDRALPRSHRGATLLSALRIAATARGPPPA